MMTLKRTLIALVNVVADEATRNPGFRARVEAALGIIDPMSHSEVKSSIRPQPEEKRKGGRRAAAVLDPVELAKHGEMDLRKKLDVLDLESLLDIVAQYGMDPGKLVMKWKDRERVVDRIVEVAVGRATKGDAFRKD